MKDETAIMVLQIVFFLALFTMITINAVRIDKHIDQVCTQKEAK